MSESTPPSDELQGLDPGELLARGLKTVRPSTGASAWIPPAPEELARLLPQYRIESLLGHGGMGAVYKGTQVALDRTVAIKLLPTEVAADEQFIARFQREARTLAKLQHPGIVAVYDFGQTSEGHLYFVMEYVDGTDLHRLLQTTGLNPAQTLELIHQVCEALHYAHGQGVIHRDIKPANILITRSGQAKLADFGLARPGRVGDVSAITSTNVVMGTPDYMAPEQRRGLGDHRADIYALGVMLYEMLTGETPRGIFEKPSSKARVDVRIDEVVIRALQAEPELRYQRVSEMKTDVDRIRTPAPAHVAVATPPPNTTSGRPHRWTFAAIVAVLLGVIAFLIWKKDASRGSQLVVGEAPAAPTTAAIEPTEKVPADLVLTPSRPVRLGSGKDERIGFAQPGPIVASANPTFRVPISAEQIGGLKITRLFWTHEDTIPGRSAGAGEVRQLDLWLPRTSGPFCDVALREKAGSANAVVAGTRALPDGVYCLHSDVLKAGESAPGFCGLFVVNGLAKPTLGKVAVTWKDGAAEMALTIRNEGTGEFNEGRLIVTLQQESASRSVFKERWEHKVPAISAGGDITFTQSYPGANWEPATYYLYGHLNLDHVFGDTEGKFFDFKSSTFTVAPPPSATPSAAPAAAPPVVVAPPPADRPASPRSAREALLTFKWRWHTGQKDEADGKIITFKADGNMVKPWRAADAWHWKAEEPLKFSILMRAGVPKRHFLFDPSFTTFAEVNIETGKQAGIIGTRAGELASATDAAKPEATPRPTPTPIPPPPITPAPRAAIAVPATPATPAAPSQIEILKQQGPNISAWVTSPLETVVPDAIWQNLTFMKEELRDEAARKPVATATAYATALRLCALMLDDLAARKVAQTEAGGPAVFHQTSQLTEWRRDHLTWPMYAVEHDERNDRKQWAAKNSGRMVDWQKRTNDMRYELGVCYNKFREALRQSPAPR